MLQDRKQDTPQDMTHDITKNEQDTELIIGVQSLTLELQSDMQNLMDAMTSPSDMQGANSEEEKEQALMMIQT